MPDALAAVWHGCGGSTPQHTAAALKLQVRLDLTAGTLAGPFLQAGRANDGSAPTQTLPLPCGAVRLADLGYFTVALLQQLSNQEVDWLSRLEARAVVCDPQGRRWSSNCVMDAQHTLAVDLSIQVGVADRLPALVGRARAASVRR